MMRGLLGILFLLSSSLYSNPIPVKIVSDVLLPEQADELDMGFRILLSLNQQLETQGYINVELIPASRLREWRELTSQPDVCLYNKVKTKAREAFAEFTKKPIVAFPPNRFVVHTSTQLPDVVSLNTQLHAGNLRIGAVSGRAYGKEIDALFTQHSKKVTWISGKDAAKRLRLMFAKGKFDAIIEYSATFTNEPDIELDKLSFHKLAESNNIVFGYIACARSSQGRDVIDLFNELLKKPVNQKMIADAHYAEFFGQEARFVQQAISQKLKNN